MLKRILIIFIIFSVLVCGFVIYINKVLIPVKIKSLFIENIEKSLGRKVQIEKVSYNIFKGFVIKNISISDDPTYGDRLFLKADEISFNFFWLPIFQEKKIIIPNAKISSLQFNITHNQNLWNFSDILTQPLPLKQNKNNKTSFLIYKIDIINARGIFEDKSFPQAFSREISDLDIKLRLFLPVKVKFSISTKIKNQINSTSLSIKGEFDFLKKVLYSQLSINSLPWIEYNLYYQNLPFEAQKGTIDNLNLNLQFKKDDYLNTKYNLHATDLKITTISGNFKNITLSGTFGLEGNFDYNFKQQLAKYEGKFLSENTTLEGLPEPGTLSGISGEITFDHKKISTKDLIFYFENIPLNLAGTLINYQALPYLDIKGSSEFDLANIKNTLKEKFDIDAQLQGKTSLELSAKGYLGQKGSPEIQGKLIISDAWAKFPKFDDIQNLQCMVEFDRKKIDIKNLEGKYHTQDFKLNGFITNFTTPFIEANFSSDKLSFKTKFNLEKKNLFISYLEGNYLNLNYNLKGRANLETIENPELLFDGVLKFNLNELKNIFPQIKSLDKLNPQGNCQTNISMSGRLEPWRNWTASLAVKIPDASINGFRFDNFTCDYKQINGIVQNFRVLAHPYQGNLQITGEADFNKQNYIFNMDLTSLNLEKLKLDTPFKDKDISGTLNSTAIIVGQSRNLGNITGKLIFTITEGKLWEMNFLKGLGKFLYLSNFDKIIFKEAYGEFLIANKYLYTNNSYLKSDEMHLFWEGAIGFDGSIDFRLTTQMSPSIQSLIENRNVFGQILGEIGQVTTIRLTGTIKEPKYSVLPLGTDFLKNIKDIFRGNAK